MLPGIENKEQPHKNYEKVTESFSSPAGEATRTQTYYKRVIGEHDGNELVEIISEEAFLRMKAAGEAVES